MSLAKLAVACGLIVVALTVSACGIEAKPVAGTAKLNSARGNHAKVNDPRTPYLPCLRAHHFPFTQELYGSRQLRAIQVGTVPNGPTIVFEPTPGIAEGDQMEGANMGGEVIGSAVVYPHRTPDKEMAAVESCVSEHVKG